MTRSDLSPPERHLLLIEDEDPLRRALQLLLLGHGFRVHAFARVRQALEHPSALAASHLVVDYVLPETDGIEALRELREQGWIGCAILVTAFYTPRLREAAIAAGFSDVLAKPFHDAALIEALALGPRAAAS